MGCYLFSVQKLASSMKKYLKPAENFFFRSDKKGLMTRIFLGIKIQKTRATPRAFFSSKHKSVFWEHFFFRTNNRVKNLVKTFQCVMCATAYLPTHSLKSPAFLVPATLDDEGKNANFPSTPPHCRRHHRVCRRSSRRIIHECS